MESLMYRYTKLNTMTRPAPVIDLKASLPGRPSLTAESRAIIDTGASITCVPKSIIAALGKGRGSVAKPMKVRGALGTRNREVYVLDLELGNCYFPQVRVVVLDMEYALIGRDILNDYKITLDAPNDSWGVAADCT